MPNPPHLVRERLTVVLGACALSAAALVGGCEKEAPPPPPPAPAPAPVVEVSPLEGLKMDPRVQFPQEREPSTRELAEAIATLASAFVKGDANAAKSVLSPDAGALIDAMVATGEWKTGTASVETVRVCVLSEQADSGSATLGLGIQDATGAYLLAWRGSNADGVWEFAPMPLNDTEAAQVALLDGSPMVSRALPGPESVSVDPEARKIKVRKMFSKDGNG